MNSNNYVAAFSYKRLDLFLAEKGDFTRSHIKN